MEVAGSSLRRAAWVFTVAGLLVLAFVGFAPMAAEGQAPGGAGPFADGQDRLQQVLDQLDSKAPGAAGEAVDQLIDTLYGGLRPLPTGAEGEEGGVTPESAQAAQAVSELEQQVAEALEDFATKDKSEGASAEEARAAALEVKLFIEQVNEVAHVLGQHTAQCPQPEPGPCQDLLGLNQPVLPLPVTGAFDPPNAPVALPLPPLDADGCAVTETQIPGMGVRLQFGPIGQFGSLLPPPFPLPPMDPLGGDFGPPMFLLAPVATLDLHLQAICLDPVTGGLQVTPSSQTVVIGGGPGGGPGGPAAGGP